MDHPFWYRDILLNMPSNSAVLCVDRNHMNFVSRFYPNIAVTGFLSHGGTAVDYTLKRVSERNIDVLYAGSLYKSKAESQKPNFSQWDIPGEEICKKTIAYLMEHRHVTIEKAFEQQLQQAGIELEDDEFIKYMSACGYIERVVSSNIRGKCLEIIAISGISLTLYGDGWNECDWVSLPNVHYGGMIRPEEVLVQMENAKIVLNTLPWFKDGSHERVFNGMLRGCVVVSESSGYLNEILPQEVWTSFDVEDENLDELADQIKTLLGDSDRMQAIADAGYELCENVHTWEARAKEIHDDILQYL